MNKLMITAATFLLCSGVSAKKVNPEHIKRVDSVMMKLVGEHSNSAKDDKNCKDVEIKVLENAKGFRIIDGRRFNKIRTSILYKNAVIKQSNVETVISGTSIDPTCIIGCVPFTQFEKTKIKLDRHGKLLSLEFSERTSGENRKTTCKF